MPSPVVTLMFHPPQKTVNIPPCGCSGGHWWAALINVTDLLEIWSNCICR